MQRRNYQDRSECWKPANRQQYFLILAHGVIRSLQWNDTVFDHEVWNFGNCFRSRKEAEKALNGMKEYFAHLRTEASMVRTEASIPKKYGSKRLPNS